MPSISEIQEAALLTAELVNDYTIGALAESAGISGGVQLQEDASSLLVQLGVEVAPPVWANGIESGLIGSATALAIRSGLKKTAQKAGASLAKNPAQWGKALGLALVSGGVYNWLTPNEAAQLEQIRLDSQVLATTLESMSPEDKAQVALTLAGKGGAMAMNPLMIGGIALVGLGAFYLIGKKG